MLVESGLIVRKDSANGKRYARKDGAGQIERAFGFDLSPLLARSEELAMMAQQVMADRAAFRMAKESLTICRRDVRKLITAAMEEGAEGDWQAVEEVYVELVGRIPRAPTLADVESILEEMWMLQEEIINRLEIRDNSENNSTNAAQSEQHIQNSKPESVNELEPRSEKEQGAKPSEIDRARSEPIKAFPLGMILKACPTIGNYGPSGAVASWRDLMSAAVVVRSMLGSARRLTKTRVRQWDRRMRQQRWRAFWSERTSSIRPGLSPRSDTAERAREVFTWPDDNGALEG